MVVLVLSFKLYFLVVFTAFSLNVPELTVEGNLLDKDNWLPRRYTGKRQASCVWTTESLTIASDAYFQIYS